MPLNYLTKLTAGHYRVIRLIASEGLTNKQLAEQLNLTPGTVHTYMHEIFRLLLPRVSSRTELVMRWNAGQLHEKEPNINDYRHFPGWTYNEVPRV